MSLAYGDVALAGPEPNVKDVLDFVVDFQDKQETEFLASGQPT